MPKSIALNDAADFLAVSTKPEVCFCVFSKTARSAGGSGHEPDTDRRAAPYQSDRLFALRARLSDNSRGASADSGGFLRRFR